LYIFDYEIMQARFLIMMRIIPVLLICLLALEVNGKSFNISPLKEYDEDFYERVRFCQPTSNFAPNQKMPLERDVVNSNNLRRKSGEGYFATGRKIKIIGRVMDASCIPIPDAIVEIWHADAFGSGNYEDDEDRNAETESLIKKIAEITRKEYESAKQKNTQEEQKEIQPKVGLSIKPDKIEERKKQLFRLQTPTLKKDEFFNQTGKSITNNVGEYVFLTIMPSSRRFDKTPVINFRVIHPKFGEIFTKMYFPCYARKCSNTEMVHYNKARDYEFMSNLYAIFSQTSTPDEDVFLFNLVFDGLDKNRYF
jgi:protocatechuate 3,4-dioxygenase beta subunit